MAKNRSIRVGIPHFAQDTINIRLELRPSPSSSRSPSNFFISRKGPDVASLFLPSHHALCISLSWQTTLSRWSTAKHNRHTDIKWLSWASLYRSAYWPRARARLRRSEHKTPALLDVLPWQGSPRKNTVKDLWLTTEQWPVHLVYDSLIEVNVKFAVSSQFIWRSLK